MWKCYRLLSNLILLLNLSSIFPLDYSNLVDNGHYTCDDIKYWLGTEKHYSSKKRESLFKILGKHPQCSNKIHMPLFLSNVMYNNLKGNGIFQSGKERVCKSIDDIVVILLSNFSINHNYSHFLHSLLRLFCALIDSGLITWNKEINKFESKQHYTIWLDQYFKLNETRRSWIEPLLYQSNSTSIPSAVTLRSLGNEVKVKACLSAKKLVYGSGCVRLLPPEKWFGFPGCRSKEILPAFGFYYRQLFNISNINDQINFDSNNHNAVPYNQHFNNSNHNHHLSGVETADKDKYHMKTKMTVSFSLRLVGDQTGSKYA